MNSKSSVSSERLISVQDIPNRMSTLRGRPIYLTVDLDWFDPAVMPGTGTPEPGGFVWNDFAAVINELRHHRLMGADVVELAPQLDPSGISSVLAAKVTRSLLLLMASITVAQDQLKSTAQNMTSTTLKSLADVHPIAPRPQRRIKQDQNSFESTVTVELLIRSPDQTFASNHKNPTDDPRGSA